MNKTVLHDGDDGVLLIVRDVKKKKEKKHGRVERPTRAPVHVVYGGADRFNAGTPRKLGDIALRTLETYAPNFIEFAAVVGLPGTEAISASQKDPDGLEKFFLTAPENLKTEDHPAWLAATIYHRTRAKLQIEPVEDFRIDFEDGYGFRPDDEEDRDAAAAAMELASALREHTITPFSGFRVKAYSEETRERAKRTLNIFLDTFLDATDRTLPENFVVTLPKVTDKKEVAELCRDLKKIEKKAHLNEGSIGIEIMVEHPLAIIDRKGDFALKGLVKASRGRCVAAHFGAYDYTAGLGIAASHQGLDHPACQFARQMMLAALTPLGVRLSDSVTTQLPVPAHKGADLNEHQVADNRSAVHSGWKVHFENVRRSMAGGFYQSWDLHPNQLIARYAAVYSFFLENEQTQAARLRAFLDKATQATLTGNAFDDAASAAGIVNFFRQGLDCGAWSEDEIKAVTGLTAGELRNDSFKALAETATQASAG